MPVYEFLCPTCNRVYSFYSRVATDAEEGPSCPRCGRNALRRQISRFNIGRGGSTGNESASEGPGGSPGLPEVADDALADPRVERELMKLMQDAEGIDESDPRQLGQLMRRMGELTGEGLDPMTEEAVRRLEAGEDPERIEEDLGDAIDGGLGGPAGMSPGAAAPTYDDGLYEW